MAPIEAEFSCPAVLETERLRLRPLAEKDIPAIVALAGAWDVARYTANIPHPYAEADARAWLDGVARSHANGTHWTLALADPRDDALMGAVALRIKADRRTGTVSYWLGKPFWGRGLMSEAIRRFLRACFD